MIHGHIREGRVRESSYSLIFLSGDSVHIIEGDRNSTRVLSSDSFLLVISGHFGKESKGSIVRGKAS